MLMSDGSEKPSDRGFYGRRAGKTLTGRQAELVKDRLHQLLLNSTQPPPQDLTQLFSAPVTSIWFESGFGGGEHLIFRALENPAAGFIGVEPFKNGMAKVLVGIEDAGLSNVRLYDEETGPLLDWLPENSLDGFYLLYPDPWPKMRHFKRRFINQRNLTRIARVLKPGAELRVASDIDSYIKWTLEHCAEHPAIELVNESEGAMLKPWPNWPGTRYEAKAIREGRLPRYLTFRQCRP